VPQHRAVIDAAKRAGVKLLAYTSLLHADTSPLGLAAEHQETEALLRESGLPHVLLRNGWYSENYAAGVPAALAHGVLLGSAGSGRIASAARADYAAAAATVLTLNDQAGRIYELAGDTAYTLTELAAEISAQSGKEIAYKDLPEADYKAILLGAGLPEGLAALLADSDTGASKGGLFDDSHQLSQLIGHPTTTIATSIAAALKT
jgi:NAD(P)H dehydrogenase (quinone)